jgi:predicted RNA-binding protein YlxR (DUF448 family)
MVQPSSSSRAPLQAVHTPVRTCVGCRQQAARSDLVRVTLVNGRVVVDNGATQPGRGAWLHRDPDCLALALKRRAFARAFRTSAADANGLVLG